MTSVTYTNLNKLLLIRDIQEIAKTYINDDRSYRWIWKNKIADIYHIGYVTFMNYISVSSINAKIDEVIAIKAILIIPNPTTGSADSRIFLFIATYSNTQV